MTEEIPQVDETSRVEITLNEDQQNALDILKEGHNVFITGFAGSGKSKLIETYEQYLKENNAKYTILAPSGVAAVNIKGMTIHHFMNFKITLPSVDKYLKDPSPYTKEARKNIELLEVMIIDEISMVNLDVFTLMEEIFRNLKDEEQIFGGVQLVLVGDFFQLPPVQKGPIKHLFSTQIWQDCNLRLIELKINMRQENDFSFSQALNKLRIGEIDKSVKDLFLKGLTNKPKKDEYYIKLFTKNCYKDEVNKTELNKLDSTLKKFTSINKGKKTLLSACIAPEILYLKIGARVMLIKNLNEYNLYNGSLGKVIDFSSKGLPIVQFEDSQVITLDKHSWEIEDKISRKILAKRTQIPLILSYAITTHKVQGLTLQYIEIDMRDIFSPGMIYVALSRARCLDNIIIKNFNPSSLSLVDPKVQEFYKTLN